MDRLVRLLGVVAMLFGVLAVTPIVTIAQLQTDSLV